MRVSKIFGKTSKTEGTDLTIVSNRLLVQGGFIRESNAGRYYLLPLGQIVHDKVIDIVRKHMNALGAQELTMPVLHPLELWEETNRTKTTGFELMKVKDRRDAEFALGGTAEEMAVDLVRKFNISYRDLPFNIYQFSMKFRDEMRARGGLLRAREFVMKDAYSFSTKEQFGVIYKDMWEAYMAIYKEMGLEAHPVAADNGYIGGEYCHEFIVESEIGESRYFIDKQSSYAAHEDVATFKVDDKNVDEALREYEEKLDANRGTTMEEGVRLHGLPLWQQLKDVLYFDEPSQRYILAVIRGDLDVNETKLTHIADAWGLRTATDDEIRDDLDSEPGFISPVRFIKKGKKTAYKVVVVADSSLRSVHNMYGGANKKSQDAININIDRDYQPDVEGDIAMAQAGKLSSQGGELIEKRGIEVGNIFQLGHHYSKLMKGAEYTDEQGERQQYYMGCYGIGIGRTLATIVEKFHDDKGIIWPDNIAPAKVYLASLGQNDKVVELADSLYQELSAKGVEVLYDDRDERAGNKFADADLLGITYRVVISDKTLESSDIEVKHRKSGKLEHISRADLIKMLVA